MAAAKNPIILVKNKRDKYGKVQRFTINRKQWYRGKDGAMLLRSIDNKMCCLGLYSIACGLKPIDILDARMPYDIDTAIPQYRNTATDAMAYQAR